MAELSRTGQTRTQLEHPLQQQVQHHRTAMALKFQNIFAGKRVGGWEQQGDAAINRLPDCTAKICIFSTPGLGYTAQDLCGNPANQWAGYPHYTNATITWRSGDGGYGLLLRHRLASVIDYLAAFSICRVMYHCCEIDRMLLTTQYNTRPAGKVANIMVNTNGSAIMILACIGSGGVGFSFC